jgi:uncharacterized protein with PQ loop repeat
MDIKTVSDILLYTAGILWGLELYPQIYQTVTTKSSKDLNLIFFSTCVFAYILSIIGNSLVNNYVIVYASIPSLIGNTIMVYLIIKYRR